MALPFAELLALEGVPARVVVSLGVVLAAARPVRPDVFEAPVRAVAVVPERVLAAALVVFGFEAVPDCDLDAVFDAVLLGDVLALVALACTMPTIPPGPVQTA